eukprot:TRINITY_DN5464_c0_g1_i1.p1 TRINITY_DN5464_c0_g1~~TRINITY_DN5464_c0_g1_i1.p1  ORF type:complete len:109 (+),score=26.37 TRINITY_DN5464_c0_g1_i1:47-328(+)
MALRCAFCNNSICFGEVTENGKVYHAKCAPSQRKADPDAPRIVKVATHDVAQKQTVPGDTIGTIEIQKGGVQVDPRSGHVSPSNYAPPAKKAQ